jgi:hypothetical protein
MFYFPNVRKRNAYGDCYVCPADCSVMCPHILTSEQLGGLWRNGAFTSYSWEATTDSWFLNPYNLLRVDKIMETLRIWRIKFCCLHWKNFSWQHWMFFRLFTLCSTRVQVSSIVLSDNPCEKIGKWETCPILKEGSLLVSVKLDHLRWKLPHY